MSSLQIIPSSSQKRVHSYAAITVPKLQRVRISLPKNPITSFPKLVHDQFNGSIQTIVPSQQDVIITTTSKTFQDCCCCDPNKREEIIRLYAILKVVADRVEMHKNIAEQRNNWNCIVLNSINITMIRLNSAIVHNTTLRLTSTILFTAAKGILLIMNKIQTSKRKATTLFKQLQADIETKLTCANPTDEDVNSAMERVLALVKAYPLPLLGTMLDKFPSKFEPRTSDCQMRVCKSQKKTNNNGWTPELEMEMRQIIEAVNRKDMDQGYDERLGKLALKVNKTLAILGPLFTAIAALSSSLEKQCSSSWAGVVAVTAGSLADFINPLEGIVFEMYKNCGGFLKDTIEATLEEKDCEKRENGEVFEMKVAMKLGRTVCQLRELAAKYAACDDSEDGIAVDNEFSLQVMYSILT